MKICSACLLGMKCRYNGKTKSNEKIIEMAIKEELIPICPEQLGGMATPRKAVELKNGRAITGDGEDQTESYIKGAEETLKICKLLGINEAILKQGSPSCGCGKIYDGSFGGKMIDGDGLVTKLLKENGIKVKSEEEV